MNSIFCIPDPDCSIVFSCGIGTMLHSAKGIVGIRIDSSDNIELQNIEIYDLYQQTELGFEKLKKQKITVNRKKNETLL